MNRLEFQDIGKIAHQPRPQCHKGEQNGTQVGLGNARISMDSALKSARPDTAH